MMRELPYWLRLKKTAGKNRHHLFADWIHCGHLR